MYELEVAEARLKTVIEQRNRLRSQVLTMQRARDAALAEVQLMKAQMQVFETKNAEMKKGVLIMRRDIERALRSAEPGEQLKSILDYTETWV